MGILSLAIAAPTSDHTALSMLIDMIQVLLRRSLPNSEAVAQLGIALQSLLAKETRSLEMAIVSNLPEPEDPVEQKTEDAQSAPP